MADSSKYLWVTINRDRTPKITKRFAVSAHPSIIFLGRAEENVHRFSGFREPERFLASMAEGLSRFSLYRAGKKYDALKERPTTICDAAQVTKLFAPSRGLPAGMTFYGDSLILGQQVLATRGVKRHAKLFRLDPAAGTVRSGIELDPRVRDVCSDGKHLYALQSGWTKGDAILVLDATDGRVLREIVTEANKTKRSSGASGITFHDDHLYVQTMLGGLFVVDPKNGEIVRRLAPAARYVSGLSFDGEHLVTASRESLYLLDPKTGALQREVKINYPVRSLTAKDGVYYLMEQPIWGYDRDHSRVQIWPRDVVVHKVVLR